MMDYSFDPVAKRDALVEELRAYAKSTGFEKVVIGISGGKDSTVAAALCARALGPENVYGVMLPDKVQPDLSDSIRICEALGIQRKILNIGQIHKALLDAVADSDGFDAPYHKQSDINVAPRLRMTVLRYLGQMLGARLVGTGNLSEATVGYCTKDGDTSCDFALLATLTSVEVVQVGLTMEEIPKELALKTPTDGLTGKPDEENLGVTYQQIHDYIRHGSSNNEEADRIIAYKEKANRHKRMMPVVIGS